MASILYLGIVDLLMSCLGFGLFVYESSFKDVVRQKESLYQVKSSKKYIFYVALTLAMGIRGLFLILSMKNIISNLSVAMIWIMLGDIAFFLVYCSMIIIYGNLYYKLKAENDYRINSYQYLQTIRPWIVLLYIILMTMFLSCSVLFVIFNHREIGSSYLIRCNIGYLVILSAMYLTTFCYFLTILFKIITMRTKWKIDTVNIYNDDINLNSINYNKNFSIFKKWRTSLLTLGVFLVSICYLGRTIFNFYDLKNWNRTFEYPVNQRYEIYMYILLETLPMIVFLIFMIKIRQDLLDVVKTKLRLRKSSY